MVEVDPSRNLSDLLRWRIHLEEFEVEDEDALDVKQIKSSLLLLLMLLLL